MESRAFAAYSDPVVKEYEYRKSDRRLNYVLQPNVHVVNESIFGLLLEAAK